MYKNIPYKFVAFQSQRPGDRLPRSNVTAFLVSALAALTMLAVPAKGQTQNPELRLQQCDYSYATPADAECGTLRVAEDPARPEGSQIDLNVMRVPAVSAEADDPLFIIVGGPGGAAVRSAVQYLPYFRAVQRKRDLIFVDQRGTGDSNGLRCPFEQIEFAPLTDEQRQQRAQDLAASCAQGLQAELEYYTTPFAVQDLEQVRQSLGYQRINAWGVSYGTRVVLEYMRQYPDALRTAVLDGVAPVSIQLPQFAAEDGGRALANLLQQCDADPRCAAAYGDLRGGWLALLEQLQENPRVISVHHPRSQQQLSVQVSAAVLSNWVQLSLYSRELAPLIPQAMQRAIEGDFTVFAGIALMASEQLTEHVSQGMQATVLCAEDRRYASVTDGGNGKGKIEAQDDGSKLLWLDRAELFDQLCEPFPQGHLPETYFSPVQSAVPTLLLSGSLDPVTPPRWAERVAQGLANSRHLRVAGAHHGVTMQGCVPRLVEQFIASADSAAVDASCTQQIKTPPFFIDGAGPALSGGSTPETK